jgi:hypothetical protein
LNRFLALTLTAFASLTALNAHAADPAKGAVTFDRVYVPNGFDSNDLVQIVGEGTFANACYRPAEVSVRVDQAAKKIYLGPAAYKYSGFCLQVVLPFERTIDLGLVPAGDYTIVGEESAANNRDKVLGTIKVKEAVKEEADDFLYAPISQAFIRQSETAGNAEIVLQGDFPSNCMVLEEVKTSFQGNNVIVVQPIAKMEDRNGCLRGRYPFSKVINVGDIKADRYLLHVRSLNAKAINTLIDLK